MYFETIEEAIDNKINEKSSEIFTNRVDALVGIDANSIEILLPSIEKECKYDALEFLSHHN